MILTGNKWALGPGKEGAMAARPTGDSLFLRSAAPPFSMSLVLHTVDSLECVDL